MIAKAALCLYIVPPQPFCSQFFFPMQHIPQELIDLFIGFILNDPKSLCSARLVNRSWYLAASVHLFRSLDLSIYELPKSQSSVASCHGHSRTFQGPARFEALLAILRNNDDIAHSVREVKLGRTSPADNLEKQDHYARLISSILSHLHQISLVIFLEMNWSQLSPAFLSCILNLCRTPTLNTIEIWNCQMPSASSLMDFFNASRDVRSLRISYMRINNAPPVEENEDGVSAPHELRNTIDKPRLCTASLYSLAIDSAPDAPILHKIFSTQSFAINFSELRRLYLSNVNDVTSLTKVLGRVGHSLEVLDLRLLPGTFFSPSSKSTKLNLTSIIRFQGITKPPFPELSAVGLDLSHCTRLQHLCISGFCWTPSFCPAKFLVLLFGKISNPSYSLEYLRVYVSFVKLSHFSDSTPPNVHSNYADTTTQSRPKDLDYSAWNTLDAVLSLPAFTALKQFQIKFITTRDGIVDTSRLLDMFPKLTSRGVQVTCT